jgi:monothiol glutaredoxin
VQILQSYGVPVKGHNVLASEELRQGIKELTSWPTIPQIFINGEFIGGADIVAEMHENGELAQLLK